MSLDELARATCAIYVGDHRDGTGTLVTDSYVLTAAHVLRRAGDVTIRFRDGLQAAPIPVRRLSLGTDADQLDVAVLTLAPGADRPRPAKLWPVRRLPPETRVFGYPRLEGSWPRGVWRDSTLSGTAGQHRVQLDWSDAGTLEGHSGGPVCDKQSGLVAGVLVEGSDAGRFDRFVPLPAIRSVWHDLPRPWLFATQTAQAHFAQRAAGQQTIARRGDLFQGRQAALAAVLDWLTAAEAPGLPLVITAQPGAGKSTVLSRAVLDIERTRRCDGVAFHARHATIGQFIDAVAAACGLEAPASWQDLVAAMTDQEGHDILVVAIDALDEAAGPHDRADLGQALRELARLDWLRVAVATRPLSAGDPYRLRSHLYDLGVLHGPDSGNLIDLDADNYFDPRDLTRYVEVLLAEEGYGRPGPPGAAWITYRENAELRGQLARLVAGRADRNYLVAGITALQLAEDEHVLLPATVGLDPSALPGSIGEALTKYFDGLENGRRERETGLLTALAYARGPGLDDQRWLAFARALGYDDVTSGGLAELRAGGGADYLLEPGTDSGMAVTWLFHRALADELKARRHSQRSDEMAICQLLRAECGDHGWLAASPYGRNYAPAHAAAAGVLEQLLTEADFLVAMAPGGMSSVLRGLARASDQDPAAIYAVTLPFLSDAHGSNAAVLEFVSRMQGNDVLARALGQVRVERPYEIAGKIRRFDRPRASFDGHTAVVHCLTTLTWPGVDHSVIVTGSADGTARVWDPQRPDDELARFDGHSAAVLAVAALVWRGVDHSVVVTGSADGTARVWDPLRPEQELARFTRHNGAVTGVAALLWPGLDTAIVSTSADRTARVWDPLRPERELARFDRHGNDVMTAVSLTWPGLDHPVLVTASWDDTARVWDPLQPDRELARFDAHTDDVQDAAILDWPGLDHPVVITTSYDATARVWDPLRPDRELARFDGHASAVMAAATLDWPGRDHRVIVTAGADGTARVWDPLQPDLELARFDGHAGIVRDVVTLPSPSDSRVIVTAASDAKARVWDPRDQDRAPGHFEGDTGGVMGVVALDWPGLEHPVILTACLDGTARVWDPRRRDRELARLTGHAGWVWAVAAMDWPGLDHQVVVTASTDRTARVWDPLAPEPELACFRGHQDKVWAVATMDWPGLDHPVVVTGSADNTARVWDPLAPERELARFDGHTGALQGLAILDWPGLDHDVIVSVATDMTARVWDPLHPDRELARFDGHTGWVWAVATMDWHGLDHRVVVTAATDGTARVWDPLQPDRELARFGGHTGWVWAVATMDWPGLDHQAVVSTSLDRTARIWDPRAPHRELAQLPLLGEGHSIAVLGPSDLVVTARGFLMFTWNTTEPG